MARKELYEPAARLFHSSFASNGRLYVWGGRTVDFETASEDDEIKLGSYIEQFDSCHEVWRQLNTAGTPHPGLAFAACASIGENVYMYGGYSGRGYEGVLSKLNLKTLTWSQLSGPETAGGPMRKNGCGLIIVHDKLVVIGGYGIPTGPIQPQAAFIRDTTYVDRRGWSNEIHDCYFNIRQGLWSSPTVRGVRPPPCSAFTLTSIDNHRAILFGGRQPERGVVNDLYIIDFHTMELSKLEPRKGEPWPAERNGHAACCIGYAGDHIHLLVSGGVGRDGKPLNDVWLFDLSLKKWREVTLPDGSLPRWAHSVTAITLCPGLVNVVMFGGSPVKYHSPKEQSRLSETTVITFILERGKWVLVGVTNSSQIGNVDKIREKILQTYELARDENTQLQESLSVSQAREMALEQRVEEVEAEIREQERRTAVRLREVEQQHVQRLQQVQQDFDRTAVRLREVEQQQVERERAVQVRIQQVQQDFDRTAGRLREVEQQARQAQESEARTAGRLREVEQHCVRREQAAEVMEQEVQQYARQAQESERRTAGRLREVEQQLAQSERQARQAEALIQEESHWLVQRREIELTEEERGKGGWAAVKVANFRGTRVAAKCFYEQIASSRYYRQLFHREMNMAARLRHPNLVQFIGASPEGEPIILTELMTTSLRSELERGPIDHAHITSISLDVARAINYLHLTQPHPIIHRDVSSANVLLDPLPDNRWKAKLSDYGSVNLVRELRTVGPGSPVYAAPEANVPAHQSTNMDIFSFGVLLVEMLTDEFPQVDARQRLIDSINHTGYVELIRRCLKEERDDRPSAIEIIANILDM